MKRMTVLLLALLFAPLTGATFQRSLLHLSSPAMLQYLAPPDGGRFVPPTSMVSLRLDGPIDPQSLSPGLITITGSVSGRHIGKALLATDGATVVFKPSVPFAAGETVTVAVGQGLRTLSGAVFGGQRSSFSVSAQALDEKAVEQDLAAEDEPQIPAGMSAAPSAAAAVTLHPQDDVTFPHDFPVYTITVPASGTAQGSLFMAPISIATGPSFLYIADDSGEPVYWQRMPPGISAFDFKQQPDGSLTYFDQQVAGWHVLDNTYSETRVITAANGYAADVHDLQILPNGDALFLTYDFQQIDMSQIITGGVPTATVLGLVIQELDTTNLPVFQWSSWDHFLITDTYQSLTSTVVDPIHANAIARDNDGNLLLSSRHMNEITKIGRDGHILWRLGGKNNQFTFQNDSDGQFSCQHDIRRLANGDITMFDNHNMVGCSTTGGASRAVEYQMGETARVVTNTWEFRNTPDEFSPFTGNNQYLPDGHRLIDWGFAHPNVTEVLTDGTKLFEMTFDPSYLSYRAFRFPWAAVPSWDPTLVVVTNTVTPTLYYSWNGATDVASYEVYGGWGQSPTNLLGTQTRTAFEDHAALVGVPASFCAFRVRPIDHEGRPQRFSNVVYTRTPCNVYHYAFSTILGP